MKMQIDLFEHVAGAYAQPRSGQLNNNELYRITTSRAGIDPGQLEHKTKIGKSGEARNTLKRKIRWHQQTLKQMGFLRKVENQKGVWELTAHGRDKLRRIQDGIAVVAFNTDLGLAVWGNCHDVFKHFDEPIFLALTSPPYMLRNPRAYGNPQTESDYIDFICRVIEPITKNLVRGGNIALNLPNDIFERGSPARSLYLEKLTIALCERFDLHLMDRLIWESNKPPGPIQWASKQRMQLNSAYEVVLIFCNSPLNSVADNRRVLEPHSSQHLKLISKGGEKRTSNNGDGAYRLKPGSYSQMTEGKIPRNVLPISNYCADQREYKKMAQSLGLQPHGAAMPLTLARKLIRFLTDVDQLVVDPCAGSCTTGLACELESRPWFSTDTIFDYVRGAAERFRQLNGFELHLRD